MPLRARLDRRRCRTAAGRQIRSANLEIGGVYRENDGWVGGWRSF